jgi:hypothetical protein
LTESQPRCDVLALLGYVRRCALRAISAALLIVMLGSAAHAQGSNNVQGYIRQDGTYVQPHMRTNPDNSRTNNWSAQGNTNPYTGRQGTVDPYQPQQQQPNSGYGVNNLNRPRY